MSVQHVLVVNCGSSSLKFAVMDANSGDELLTGLAERLHSDDATLKYKFAGDKHTNALPKGADHQTAIDTLVTLIGNFSLSQHLIAVGHRVVHGGEQFTGSQIITPHIIDVITQTAQLAPLHNPANLTGIRAAQAAFPELVQVAVFDTAFHQTMPKHAYLYALPYLLYERHGVRRYGFHGTSHAYVSLMAIKELGLDAGNSRIISAHLGNGCSVCAIKNGRSVDTSMGLTPLEGVVMGTRSGDIDPGLFDFLTNQLGYASAEVSDILNKQSGLLGISELSNDCRTIEEAHVAGNAKATLALDIFCYRLAKQIAAYLVPLAGLDALIFTGGIGENSDIIRAKVLAHLAFLDIHVEPESNLAARFGNLGVITTATSRAQAVVIPTNEEWMICQDAARLAKGVS
ncbi:acetate kinase [Pseudoalteromonas ruthenica]|uniref:acetate kinase n=1 Tax=Pseudoalteromonas ruthenica TaxID=151081 RepID=UPI0011083721|nr:acetate kinase [Pseudoalteromonas ruthenica]TLX49507.1 acetate kinase [Pseudoalteromonas ruthenica]TMO48962.1 acetate kinase [Pseudoalteromonas ruthenica]TMO51090.1 acetate kinase [Pseudoalteromonas ruthenica]